MNKLLTNTLLLAALAMASLAASAAEPVSIGNYGDDGGQTYYQVTCSNNTRGTVIEKQEPPQICAYPANADEVCKAAWTIKKAAAYACK